MKTIENVRHGRKEAGANTPENKPDLEMTEEGIQKLIASGIKSGLEADRKATEDAKAKAQADADAKAKADAEAKAKEEANKPAITAEQVKSLIDAGVAEGLKALRKAELEAKQSRDPGDAQRSRIEIPYAWCKGNLPLHGKQLLNVVMRRDMNAGISESELRDGTKRGDATIDRMRAGAKAWTSTGAGTGDELVPQDLSAELQRRLYLASQTAALLASREVNMPTNPFVYPVSTTRPTFYLEATESTTKTATDPATANTTLTARILAAKVEFSYEINEDSIIAVMPLMQQLLAEAAADALEDAIQNGDTTSTHMDTDYQAVAKHVARAWIGFRKAANAATCWTDASTGGASSSNIRSLLKNMGIYGINKRNLALFVGPKGYNDLLADSNLITIDKIGPRATILSGEVPTIFGVPVIVSSRVREALNATNVEDGSTTTKGTYVCVYIPNCLMGSRRDWLLESDRDIDKQQFVVVASMRKAFTVIEAAHATNRPWLWEAYNYNS